MLPLPTYARKEQRGGAAVWQLSTGRNALPLRAFRARSVARGFFVAPACRLQRFLFHMAVKIAQLWFALQQQQQVGRAQDSEVQKLLVRLKDKAFSTMEPA